MENLYIGAGSHWNSAIQDDLAFDFDGGIGGIYYSQSESGTDHGRYSVDDTGGHPVYNASEAMAWSHTPGTGDKHQGHSGHRPGIPVFEA